MKIMKKMKASLCNEENEGSETAMKIMKEMK